MIKLLPLIALIAVGCAVSLRNWRQGLVFCILTAIVQDPIRKVTPGAPPVLTLSFVPAFLCMLLGMWARESPLRELKRDFPRMKFPLSVMAICVVISTTTTLTYGLGAVPIAVVGLFSYVGCFLAVLIGYKCLENHPLAMDRFCIFFIAATSIALIGVPLEFLDYQFSEPWLGTVSLNRAWYRWYSTTTKLDGGYIKMISGFYRSPEIMGWHAMMLVLFSLFMMLRRRHLAILWGLTATWGMYCVLLSGRRKMFLMILVFLLVFMLSFRQWRRNSWLVPAVLCIILLSGGLLYLVDDRYVAAAESGLHTAGATALGKGVLGPLELLERVGPFGYGVGTKTQGTQHFSFVIQTPQHEGGFERILVELGIVGTMAAVLVLLNGFYLLYWSMRKVRHHEGDEAVGVALFSMICASLASFVVTFQIFGDPFVIVLIGFLSGLLLSLPKFLPQISGEKSHKHVRRVQPRTSAFVIPRRRNISVENRLSAEEIQ